MNKCTCPNKECEIHGAPTKPKQECGLVRSKVAFMNGGRVDGYHYIAIEGTDFVICEDGHPDFVLKFDEDKKGENKARRYNAKVNKQLRSLQK